MTYGWFTHEIYLKLFCLANNIHCNRNDSNCVGSLITGRKTPTYTLNNNSCHKMMSVTQPFLKYAHIAQLICDYIQQD